MSFYSLSFFCFILLFIILHDLVGDFAPKQQWIVRLLAGISFFTYLSGVKIIFLFASAITIWSGSLLIFQLEKNNKAYRNTPNLSKEEKKASKAKTRKIKKTYVAAIIIFNLALLFFAKYFHPISNHPIALPLGISFYTLQAVSYIVDVYGEKYDPQQNFAKILLYLCWFPQLLQGPINRYDLISESLYKHSHLHASDYRYSFYVFLFGAVKKYAIADLLAPLVNAALNNNSAEQPGSFLLFGALMFAIEQYADFSGGIDMSMAISLLFGVKMSPNFKQPYFSTSLAEFWRRWHISLGSFMRDYVFYPFVTTKPISKLTKYISSHFGTHMGRAVTGGLSNLLVFSLVGLWHGPEKHYLFWGLYNGAIIAISDALSPVFSKLNRLLHINTDGKGMYVFRVFRTFMIIVFAGYFDVIGPVYIGLLCFKNTLLDFDIACGLQKITALFADGVTSSQAVCTAGIATILLFTNSVLKENGKHPVRSLCDFKFWKRWPVCFFLIILLLYSFTVSSGIRGFMYAAF